MNRALIAAALVVAAPAFGAPFELKGFRLGQSIEQMQALFPGLHCGDASSDEDGQGGCIYTHTTKLTEIPGYPLIDSLETLAGANVSSWDLDTYRGKLGKVQITTHPSDFEQIAAALTLKFGKPARETSVLRNGFGAPFQQVTLTWRRGGERLRLWKYAGTVDSGILILTNDAFMAAEERAKRAKARKGAGDL